MIREATPSDAKNLLALFLTLDHETKFMLFEESERTTTVEQLQRRLEVFEKSDAGIMLILIQDNLPIGFVTGMGGNVNRNRHVLNIVIGISQKYTGQGNGRKLLEALENWAIKQNFHRLQLTVMTHNKNAIKLYERFGFEQEGIRKDALCVDGNYVDEFNMAKLLS